MTPQTQFIKQDDPCSENDTLFILGFTLFLILLIAGELAFLVWCTKQGYIDMILEMIP